MTKLIPRDYYDPLVIIRTPLITLNQPWPITIELYHSGPEPDVCGEYKEMLISLSQCLEVNIPTLIIRWLYDTWRLKQLDAFNINPDSFMSHVIQ